MLFSLRRAAFGLVLGFSAAVVGTSSGFAQSNTVSVSKKEIDSLRNQVKEMMTGRATLEKNLETFDTLDFVVYSNQEWTRLHESHDKNIKVNWPDGHTTVGIEKHIEDLKGTFVFAPDTKIKQHPIRFGTGNGEWTAATGVMEGTFSKPMPVEGGKSIQPTGKAFKVPMCTIGHWKNGVMVEESLFWDNQTFMNQMGLGGK